MKSNVFRFFGGDEESIFSDEDRISYVFLAPLIIFLILLVWLPFFQGIWMSFHNWPFGAGEPIFLGLENYTDLFTSDVFYTSLKATVIYSFATVIQLIIAIAAALCVDKIRFKSLFSGMFLLPYTMPPVATGTIWLFLGNPNLGPIFTILTENNILESTIYWGTKGDPALAAVTLVNAWTFWPFMFIILYATVTSIPEEFYESGRVYGASRWQLFRYVTLPQMKSAILVVVTLRLVWNLTKVSQPLQMTGGGPGFDTSVLAILLWRNAFLDGNLGSGFTVGIVFLLLVLPFVLMFMDFFQEFEGVS